MAAQTTCCQVIDGDGTFKEQEVDAFVHQHGVIEARTNYQVVAIMGPQSSGKSTLMNHVFGTSFQEMDAMTGRQQTTKGVWMAKSPKVDDVCTLIMDLEGSDGRERGEDDTNFERQSALFALAVADVLLINVWCHDIGREQGSGKPLMKTIFQVNLKLFAPEPNRRRTVLLFVIRDKSKTPMAKLAEILAEDVHKMWDSISKPPQYTDSKLEDFFEVQYTALPHYEDKYEDFLADTVVLRRRFTQDGDDSLVRAANGRLPADSLVLSTRNIWGIIRSQKDLNLPAHKVMVANIRCNEIKLEQLRNFSQDQAWQALEAGSSSSLMRDFGKHAAGLLESCLEGYEQEAMYFDSSVRAEHYTDLASKLAGVIAGPFKAQLGLLAAQQLAAFDRDFKLALVDNPNRFSAAAQAAAADALAGFDEGAKDVAVAGTELSADEARGSLEAKVQEHIEKAKHAAVKEALRRTEDELHKLIAVPAVELLQSFPANLWQQLHTVRSQAVSTASTDLSSALAGVTLSAEEQASLQSKLQAAADKKLRDLLQEAALTRVTKMRDVFNSSFGLDEHGTPRTWRPRDNIPQLARQARREAARVLALLAVKRSGDYTGGDAVEDAIMAMVKKDIDEGSAAASGSSSSRGDAASAPSSSSRDASGGGAFDLATATHWPGVPKQEVLVAPHEARVAWREFMGASALAVQQAQVTQQANLMAGKRSAPVWALAAILFLGWNEFMAVLWNPVYLLLGAAMFLFGWQLYGELDVDAEMQRGPVVGLLNMWNKLGDVLRSVVARNIEMVANLGGTVSDMVQQQPGAAGQGQGYALAGAAAGSDGSGVVQHKQPRQQHQSAAGLKQRGVGQQAQQQDGLQMTQLRREVEAQSEGKDA
uniref:Protein ROOT HAIR DEFECTIVE 3 homolog n=1 Tax=Tetradesmus obliquus TaxID=3088 RepID=A0A383VTW4_TETOB|eukprot:jgi/Sobl393_1/1024/SZX77612.1